jgi:hypothetical protein
MNEFILVRGVEFDMIAECTKCLVEVGASIFGVTAGYRQASRHIVDKFIHFDFSFSFGWGVPYLQENYSTERAVCQEVLGKKLKNFFGR